MLRADGLNRLGGFLDAHLPPRAHPRQMGLRSHQRPRGAQLHFGSHRRRLFHFIQRQIHHFELSMGDDNPVHARIAGRGDHRQSLGGRKVAGIDHQLLLGTDLQHRGNRRQHLAIRSERL